METSFYWFCLILRVILTAFGEFFGAMGTVNKPSFLPELVSQTLLLFNRSKGPCEKQMKRTHKNDWDPGNNYSSVKLKKCLGEPFQD